MAGLKRWLQTALQVQNRKFNLSEIQNQYSLFVVSADVDDVIGFIVFFFYFEYTGRE